MSYACRRGLRAIPVSRGVERVYRRLSAHFGPQEWWPADTPFEVIVGAILTQAVSWSNVEQAVTNLKREGLLGPAALREIEEERLAELIRPSGYYRMKARKIKAFLDFLFDDYQGRVEEMIKEPLAELRPRLLAVYGIGPETADSILLYAGDYPVFVVDAYTSRIFHRLGYVSPGVDYHSLQQFILNNLKHSTNIEREKVALYNEFHALLVALGKDICRKSNPDCAVCPLLSPP